jgi:hypothetical protein
LWFGSVLKKKNGSNRFGSVFSGLARFGSVFFRFDSVFSVWLGFFGLAPFWLGFSQFGSVFSVPGLKNQNQTKPVGFFKILIGFFTVRFFRLFFSGFLGLIGFSVFFNTHNHNEMETFHSIVGILS